LAEAAGNCLMNAAHKQFQAVATILVASDSLGDANLIMNLLSSEFDHIFISADPDKASEDFEKHPPDVLVLAFKTMAKTESYYLGLYRLCEKVHLQPHRTVVLCSKDEVNRAYDACKKEHFDDYVQFWPMTNDPPRLLMAVHHALSDLSVVVGGGPTSTEFASQARRLSEFGNLLDRQMHQGSQKIDFVSQAISQAEQEIKAALDEFSGMSARGELPDLSILKNITDMKREINRLKEEEIGQSLRAAAASVVPVKQWAEQFKRDYAPHIESVRALNAMADQIRPMILVVDDDEFQRKIVGEFLATANFRLEFAGSGIEALNILQKIRPDLILMDILMSDFDGIETTRRVKAMPQFKKVPVIMMTGRSKGGSVRDSLDAGATNFVVKPFDRERLLEKVLSALKRE